MAVSSGLVHLVLKPLSGRRRPDRARHQVPLDRHVPMPVSTSFPSGHAASAAAFATGVATAFPEAGIPLTAAGALVAYSRVHTGVHYPVDVIAGSVAGTTTAQVTVALLDRRRRRGAAARVRGNRRGDRSRAPGADPVAPRMGGGRATATTRPVRQSDQVAVRRSNLPRQPRARARYRNRRPRPGAVLTTLAEDAVDTGADGLGVAGDDGSPRWSRRRRWTPLPFVCIPAGTRNHFALDLGVDRRDMFDALDAFTNWIERRTDVAGVNQRLFLNNVSLGVYGDAVQRPEYRMRSCERCCRPRTPSSARPSRLSCTSSTITAARTTTQVLLVSNNPYSPAPPVVTAPDLP